MADQLSAEEDLDRLPTDKELARLQRTTVLYYLHETNPDNGLVRDKTDPAAPCSIAAVGLALGGVGGQQWLELAGTSDQLGVGGQLKRGR